MTAGWLSRLRLEHPGDRAAACIWRDLAPSSEALAAEGLKFLKSQ
jgi:hypothetical protein